MSKTLHYSMLLRWSKEDQVYIVALPEWEGHIMNWDSCTHGRTYAEAARKGRDMLEFLVESTQEEGEELPEPHMYREPVAV